MQQNSIATPIAIIVAGFMIASAIFVSNSSLGYLKGQNSGTNAINNGSNTNNQQPTQPENNPTIAEDGAEDPNKEYSISVDDDPVLGNQNAPITMIAFSDYRCPFCGRFATDTLPELKKKYIDTGKIKFVMRDLSIHPEAGSDDAAKAAQCANDQGKYYQFHDLLWTKYFKQEEFNNDKMKEYAKELGLDTAKFNTCIDSDKYQAEIDTDRQAASSVGANGTPTFFIGKSDKSGTIKSNMVVGAQPLASFEQVIQKYTDSK